tara:strand:+ start:382 stop:957 length:576 start_codon:yes stop_codon:yes gene_type:complete
MTDNILVIMFIIIIIYFYYNSDYVHLKCIISDVDGEKYCVRKRKDLKKVANLLATVNVKLQMLIKDMNETYPNIDCVKRLEKNYNPKKMYETLPTSQHVAYSENKGEKIAFCVNKKKGEDELIDENTLTFVALHELSHCMTVSIGHTKEFWDNFKFLLENAVKAKVYNSVNYKEKPVSYCGMDINENPLFD